MSGIRTLLTGGQMVAYYPALARAVGGIAPALFLQQIAHWEASSNGGWVYRTQEELEEELAMSPKVQATCRRHLIDGGFLLEEHRAKNRLHYQIQWEKVEVAVQSLPTGKSRPAQRESLDQPNGSNSLKESKKKSKKDISPEGEPAPSAPDSTTADEFISYLAEELDGADVPLLQGRKSRYGKEFKEHLKKGVGDALLYKCADRIIERWISDDHAKLTVEQAYQDVTNGKPPTHTDIKSIGEASPRGVKEALLSHDALSRYAYLADQWDFTKQEPPPYKIAVQLGGDQQERWQNQDRIMSIARRTVRAA